MRVWVEELYDVVVPAHIIAPRYHQWLLVVLRQQYNAENAAGVKALVAYEAFMWQSFARLSASFVPFPGSNAMKLFYVPSLRHN